MTQIFRVPQNPHLIHTTSRVASVTVGVKPGFDPTFGYLTIDVERVFIDPLSCFLNSNLYYQPHTLHPFVKSIKVLLFAFCPVSGIILDGIHKYFKVVFPVYGFRLTIFRPFGDHLS